MPAFTRHVLAQGDNLRALGEILTQNVLPKRAATGPNTPGPVHTVTVPPPNNRLVNDYIEHVGGQPALYANSLPSHMFPQWTFAHILRTVKGASIDVFRALNGGCTLTTHALLPRDTELLLTTQLQAIEYSPSKTLLRVSSTMGPKENPESVVAEVQLIVPGTRKAGPKKAPSLVPATAQALSSEALGSQAGLQFAALTGDFNPIHWVPLYPRLFGHKNVILHGFAGMARVAETLIAKRCQARPQNLFRLELRFSAPIVLPAEVAVLVDGANVFMGRGKNERAYIIGNFEAIDAA